METDLIMKAKRDYIDRNQLHQLMRDYKDTGKISEELGQMFMTMTDHILGHSNFRNYTQAVREEMKSYALLLLVKYSHNCDAYQRDARQTFNYITTITMNAFKQVLQKYYKHLNLKRELERQYVDIMAQQGIRVNSEYLDNFRLNEAQDQDYK